MKVSRRAMGLLLAASMPLAAHEDEAVEIARTRVTHGTAGPFAVAGYRMGEAALDALGVRRGSMDLDVVHTSPAEVQWSCIVDGLQAATGASLGKLNLRWEKSADGATYSIIRNRKTGKALRFELAGGFVKENLNLPLEQLENAGYAVLGLKDEEVFVMSPLVR